MSRTALSSMSASLRLCRRLSCRAATLAVLTALLSGLLAGCSGGEFVRVASSSNPLHTAGSIAKSRALAYAGNPQHLVRDFKRISKALRSLFGKVDEQAGKAWGDDELELPKPKRYVKYTENYHSRVIVDLDAGWVRIESVDSKDAKNSLVEATVVALLTPDDPRAVDLFSAQKVTLGGSPYLKGLVADRQGHAIVNEAQARVYAEYLWQHHRSVHNSKQGHTVTRVEIPMVAQHQDLQTKRYLPLVIRYGAEYRISKSLILAIIRTESNFNPWAVSSAPAFGLMQLVPSSGGTDAWRKVHGVKRVPSREQLFDPRQNIQLGTAYLAILDQQYLRQIANPVAREYAVIAAYNGGAGNVLKTFSADRKHAIQVINSLSPAEVYKRLTAQHPRTETRRYLQKVNRYRREYASA